jgi:hypothetical protein
VLPVLFATISLTLKHLTGPSFRETVSPADHHYKSATSRSAVSVQSRPVFNLKRSGHLGAPRMASS